MAYSFLLCFFLIFGYTMFLYTSVLAYATVYHFTPLTYEPNYIIALGSGLIGDRVPPLLASRLDEAVKQYKKKRCTTCYYCFRWARE